jgi:hypothetical protein
MSVIGAERRMELGSVIRSPLAEPT